jgi:hypothetical protein
MDHSGQWTDRANQHRELIKAKTERSKDGENDHAA